MKSSEPVGVTSRSFSSHAGLRSELLELYSDVRFNQAGAHLHGDSLIDFARGRVKLIVGLERINEGVLQSLPDLEVVSKYGVGLDNLELPALARRGVRLGWTGGVNRRAVAELALGMILSLLRHVPALHQELRQGVWRALRGRQLSRRIVGIVGCGQVGKDLVRLLAPFECTVLAYDLLDYPDFYREQGVEPVPLDELLARSDVVSLHVPLSDDTRDLMSRARLARMKPGALLVNTARGGLVDEDALAEMLASGALAGAAFDVFATEPAGDSPLLTLPNFLATPHIGGSSEEAVLAMGRAAIHGLDVNQVPADDYPPAYQQVISTQSRS